MGLRNCCVGGFQAVIFKEKGLDGHFHGIKSMIGRGVSDSVDQLLKNGHLVLEVAHPQSHISDDWPQGA